MTPNKKLSGRVVQSSSAVKLTKSYNVHASGSRKTIKIEETASSKRKQEANKTPPKDLLVLNREIADQWPEYIFDTPDLPTNASEPTNVAAESEDLLEDVQGNFIKTPCRGKDVAQEKCQIPVPAAGIWGVLAIPAPAPAARSRNASFPAES
ncbi:hypothetical protein FRC08_000708, partial [Ceratobasidium sp. 394]